MQRDLRPLYTRSRGVNDPWGRGLNQSPGPGVGSFTPHLRYSSGFFAGKERRPTCAATCRSIARKLL